MPSGEHSLELVERVMSRVRDRTRMRVGPANREQVMRVARARAAALGMTVPAWVDALDLQGAGPELELLVRELTVGETYLFRGPVFDVLRSLVLPELVARKRRDGSRTLRVASAGCATGEEAYSLASCVAEATKGDPGFLTGVLGLDVNPAFLARAEEGRYRRWSLRGVDPAQLARWFEPDGDEWVVRPELRAMVRFQLINLVLDPIASPGLGLSGMDLILCQNVLIYFERDARERVIEGLSRALAPGGLLFFGPSDLVGGQLSHSTASQWTAVSFGDVVGYRRAEPSVVAPRRSSRPGLPAVNSPPSDPIAAPELAPAAPPTYENAAALADAGDVEEALAELDALLMTEHDHSPAHTLRGLLLTDAGDPAQAMEAFRRALYLDPRSLLASSGAIAAARRLGRDDLVRRHAARLRALGAGAEGDRAVDGWEGMTVRRLLQLARTAGDP